MKSFPLFLTIALVFYSCSRQNKSLPETGVLYAQMEIMDNEILPFNFDLEKSEGTYKIIVHNAEESVYIDNIEFRDDSITMRMPVYEGYIKGTYTDRKIEGHFIKESLDRVVPFSAFLGQRPRFTTENTPAVDISGNWETEFSANTEEAYMAKGTFSQKEQRVTGTFRTNTGDYRFLEGVIDGDSIRISTFDGAHAFLFVARATDSVLDGIFYSGNHFKEPFRAKRSEDFELPDANKLTFLKEGSRSLSFSFPDTNGKMVSLSDPEFLDKVVIIQIMGTWCPNCMDETKFLVEYLKNNNLPDLKIVALAFEYAKTQKTAYEGIERLKKRMGVTYPVLLAQFGSSSKNMANEKLPMLNHVLSYPTTIFVDKQGNVRRIHTGFNGPATGSKYEEFKRDFAKEVAALLSE
ncbi:MAG: peroxiredoxin family protein [Flavobacteriaceae bacterium]